MILILAFVGIMILTGGHALGQTQKNPPADLTEMSLEDLMKIEVDTVFGASKYQQKVTEAPASVSIVTADEIQKYGYRTLADVLRSVRGFYISYDRNYSYVGVRGFGRPGDYNSRILLLVDGHRLNDAIYDGALIGSEFPIDVDLIERVEIIRGPSSSLYGTSAFFGVVNVITKRGKDLKAPEVSTEVGSYGTYKGRVSYLAEMVVVAVVGIELLVGKVQAGKEFIFFKNIVGDHRLLRPRPQVKRLQLFESPHQECKLRLKRGPALPFVESVQKRIRLGLHHPLRVQPLRQNARQSALADSDRTFHCNVAGQFKKIGHGLGGVSTSQDISDGPQWQLRDELTGRI